MNVVFVRHGESEFSVRGALNGDPTVPCGLTPAGAEQARALGVALAEEAFDLAVTTEFQRTRETIDGVLQRREVPRLVVPELNDPRYGTYEGASLDEFRDWASATSSAGRPGDGESRLEIVERYALGFRLLLARPEAAILVVAHSLPIAYALAARDGIAPAARVPLAEYATPYRFTEAELDRTAAVLELWAASPTW